jgi:hypothetical protein
MPSGKPVASAVSISPDHRVSTKLATITVAQTATASRNRHNISGQWPVNRGRPLRFLPAPSPLAPLPPVFTNI